MAPASETPPAIKYGALILAGPTGVGKSEIAVEIAERCAGEIVGADAFQIYEGLPVLTAQPGPELRARVPHHLIGEIPLRDAFDVAQYLRLATARLKEIHARGRKPIVVGGTGLYLRALLRGLSDLPGADPTLRAELEAQPLSVLQSRFRALDPKGAATLDLQNPRRVIRALEVCLLTGRPFSSFRQEWEEMPPFAGCYLVRERAALNARIDARVERMLAEGAIEEVRRAIDPGPTAAQTLGLREIQALLAGTLSAEDCRAQIQQATRRYAKRQLTWLRRETGLVPHPIGDSLSPAEIAGQIITIAARLPRETKEATVPAPPG